MHRPEGLSQHSLKSLEEIPGDMQLLQRAEQGCRRPLVHQEDLWVSLQEQSERCQSYKMTSIRLLVWMFLTKQSETGFTRVAWGPIGDPMLTIWHHRAQLAFRIQDQNWQVHQWCPVLLTGTHSPFQASQQQPDCLQVLGCQTLHWHTGSWVPPGPRQCPASCVCRQELLTGLNPSFLSTNL